MENQLKTIQVVAALIWRQDRFMACRRPAHKARGLLWEFVGGKVEPGETKQQALARECKEELDIEVSVGNEVMSVTHEYPDVRVELTLFESYILQGEPKLLEHCDLKWITVDEIDRYPFCPADEVILDWLKGCRMRPATPAEEFVQGRLFAMQDMDYRDFHSRLMPTVDRDRVIGVQLPRLREFAAKIREMPLKEEFLSALPHRYYEENNLHGLLIAEIRDWDALIEALDRFLPYVDNWATCDAIRPLLFREHPVQLPGKIREWVSSDRPYTVRFGLEMLMAFYLDGEFQPEQLELAAGVESQDYYVQMMQAWYFATALAKQWDAALPYLKEDRLPEWVRSKTIQKAVESHRISDAQKQLLKQLKTGTGR